MLLCPCITKSLKTYYNTPIIVHICQQSNKIEIKSTFTVCKFTTEFVTETNNVYCNKLHQGTLSLSEAMQREILEKRKAPFLINPIIIFSLPQHSPLCQSYIWKKNSEDLHKKAVVKNATIPYSPFLTLQSTTHLNGTSFSVRV